MLPLVQNLQKQRQHVIGVESLDFAIGIGVFIEFDPQILQTSPGDFGQLELDEHLPLFPGQGFENIRGIGYPSRLPNQNQPAFTVSLDLHFRSPNGLFGGFEFHFTNPDLSVAGLGVHVQRLENGNELEMVAHRPLDQN